MEGSGRELVDYVDRSLQEEEEFHFLRFEFLQRLNIAQLQLDLVRLKSNIRRSNVLSNEDKQTLHTKLRDYATAIRDYKELRNKRSVPKKEMRKRRLLLQRYFASHGLGVDDFHSHYSYFSEDVDAHAKIDPLRQALMRRLPTWFTFSQHEKAERKKEYSEGKRPKEVSAPVDRLARFLIAFTGGSFLIVPMVIMSLDPSQTKSLITVSLAVLLFILLLSFGIRVSNVETLVATATYAAVLVVFVGTSSGNTGGQ
ncbi:uncharacterized protein THITE_2117075 [Thermothielavioides terrestris NRRL 8126]|uniref:DUF6594 domain-containing protein n=1 Tax=Thermothielavioides terrestris (strain ATCC 38088 / NRRL 8126) TaxID=578455 RepID=G2R7J7_THETT|nr:uncharacterized protein THITE_2117075 [Thermothielavioides terrestris NRRL 8126]AEO67906.1 hypothetical protein THITE_2117075 [Thermothielavioides terrestris NRRL 8126]